jgi:hypothetical protein
MTTATPAQRDDGDERVTVSASGVQVRKWLATDEAAVPVVRYELASAREADVIVRLTDRVPDHLEPDDVGFHDAHHGERWDRPDERTVRFETPLPAGEEVATLFGVRRPEIEEPVAFLEGPDVAVAAEPAIVETAGGGDAPSAADEDVDERLRRALDEAAAASGAGDEGEVDAATVDNDTTRADAGDGGATAGTSSASSGEDAPGSGDATAAGSETLSLEDPAGSAGGSTDSAVEGDQVASSTDDGPVWAGSSPAAAIGGGDDGLAADDEQALEATSSGSAGPGDASSADEAASGGREPNGIDGADPSTTESVASALVAELREGAVDGETRETLARELNLQLSASSSQFVEHLQSRMKEKRGQLEGDIERLEDSIAELYGLKADSSVVSSVREAKADADAVASIEAELEELRAETAELAALEELRADVEDLKSAVATSEELAAARSDLVDRIGALDARVSEVDERAASEDGVEELARGVRELDEDTPILGDFEALEDAHESLAADAARESDLEAVREELAGLEETLDERRDEAVADLEDRIDGERRTREDGLASLSNRVADLEDRAAAAERVASIEADLERAYVTERAVTGTIEARLERSLLARTLLVAAGVSAGAGVALAVTGVIVGVALVPLAVAGLGYWWHLQNGELDPA